MISRFPLSATQNGGSAILLGGKDCGNDTGCLNGYAVAQGLLAAAITKLYLIFENVVRTLEGSGQGKGQSEHISLVF